MDILNYGLLGSCTCEDFEMRRRPRWRDVRKPYDVFRCKHIKAVRVHVMNQILQLVAAKRAKAIEANKKR